MTAFRLEPGPMPDVLRQVVTEQVDSALAELSGETDATREEAVHEARKRFKRIRAVLRLTRDELGERVYARENAAYRDLGRRLAGIRDAHVLLTTLDGLHERHMVALPGEAFADVRDALVAREAATGRLAEEAIRGAIEDLETARLRLPEWPLKRDGFAAVEGGLARIYRQGRRRMAKAYKSGEPERFHDWRKRVKDLWHAFQLLEPVWPPVVEALADEAHELSDLLGDDHDLVVLAELVQTEALGPMELVAGAAGRSADLRVAARPLGARLYAEAPWDFVDRMSAYHAAWREGEGRG